MMLNYWLYDCLTEASFQGHPAAIIEIQEKPAKSFALKVAQELCQNVTCFFWQQDHKVYVDSYAIDESLWPINHGLLAVARHCFGTQGRGYLHTSMGALMVYTLGNTIQIALPKAAYTAVGIHERLNQALDIIPISVREMGKTCIVEVRTAEEILSLMPDFNRINRLDYDRIVVTAEDETLPFDYVCRYFSPKHGINENEASLYIQTFLPVYWQEQLQRKEFVFLQLSPRKGIGQATVLDNAIVISAPVRLAFQGKLQL